MFKEAVRLVVKCCQYNDCDSEFFETRCRGNTLVVESRSLNCRVGLTHIRTVVIILKYSAESRYPNSESDHRRGKPNYAAFSNQPEFRGSGLSAVNRPDQVLHCVRDAAS